MDLNALRAYGYPYRGTHFKHISLGSTSFKLLPLRGRHVCIEVHTYFARFHFVNFFSTGSFGPYNPLRGYGHPMGTHFQKINLILILFMLPAPSPRSPNMLVEREVGGHEVANTCHLPPADTPAHFGRAPINVGLNYRAPPERTYLFFF